MIKYNATVNDECGGGSCVFRFFLLKIRNIHAVMVDMKNRRGDIFGC
jgi:hypothetical protein